MNKCPITYEDCGDAKYSIRGLKMLSPQLTRLNDLSFTAQEQRQEAAARAAKMSIQGVQAKLSARLRISQQAFDLVDFGGHYIIKPQSDIYLQLPENEDLTMKLAKLASIEVPVHGMIYSKDGSLSYFIKRFDRFGKNKKRALEDFAQLTSNTRETKYTWSLEKLIPVIDKFCTFPSIEKVKLFRRLIFCFLTGNEDMHLKNFSLITRDQKVELAPAYDFLNTTLAITHVKEESALSLNGRKNHLRKKDFIEYFAKTTLEVNDKMIDNVLDHFSTIYQDCEQWVKQSFLNPSQKEKYIQILHERYQRLELI